MRSTTAFKTHSLLTILLLFICFEPLHSQSLNEIRTNLLNNPPNSGDPGIREQYILALEPIFLDKTSRRSDSGTFNFYKAMIDKVRTELQEEVTEGMVIWKMYNHGYLIKTPQLVFAFDLTSGYQGWPYDLPAEILDAIDVLFLSHRHPDHWTDFINKRVMSNGGFVVVPAVESYLGNLFVDESDSLTILGLEVKVHNGVHSAPVRIFEVTTPNGIKILHTGDNQSSQTLPDVLGVDFMFLNAWVNEGGSTSPVEGMRNAVNKIQPQVMIPGHILEIFHDNPAGLYSNAFAVDDVTLPSVVQIMAWGERYIVSGNAGSLPQARVSTSKITFPGTISGQSKTQTLTIFNDSNLSLNVSNISIDNLAFSASTTGLTIPANSDDEITVSFQAPGSGFSHATLTLQTDNPQSSSLQVSLSGIGMSPLPATTEPIQSLLKDEDLDYIPDRLGELVKAKGVITSPNQVIGSLFTIQDGSSGIEIVAGRPDVFDETGLARATWYHELGLMPGTEVSVSGKISFSNGNTQIKPGSIDYIEILGSGMEPFPLSVTLADFQPQKGEELQGRLVKLENVILDDPNPLPTFERDRNLTFSGQGLTVNVRVQAEIPASHTVPTEPTSILGIFSQFSRSVPPDAGYQLIPVSFQSEIDSAIISIQSTKLDEDGDFIPDRLGESVTVHGVLTSFNSRPGNLDFFIQDGTGGGEIFSGNSIFADFDDNFPSIGTVLRITGALQQFNGKEEIVPAALEDVQILGSTTPVIPELITADQLGEETGEAKQGRLIRIENLLITGSFPGENQSANLIGTDAQGREVLIRIDRDTDIDGTPTPVDTVDIIGIADQFDNSEPRSGGYQVLPRSLADIEWRVPVSVAQQDDVLPQTFELRQNYPNPFNPETTIEYHIPQDGFVSLVIFNLLGQQVVNLVNENKMAGDNKVQWHGSDKLNRAVASGIYLYKLEVAGFTKIRKLALIR